MSIGDRTADRDPLDLLAEEFVARCRQGERPALAEYVARYPELAEQIQSLFPALWMMERIKPSAGDLARHAEDGGLAGRGSSSAIERLGDFRVLRVLGRGGMGVVYEAIQESLGRRVALKVLPPHGRLDAIQLGRFRREARAAASLHHTNIVPVFAVGEEDGVPYYAMQFIDGQGIDMILDELRRLRQKSTAAGDVLGPGTTNAARLGPHGGGEAVTASITRGMLAGRFSGSNDFQAERPAGGTIPIIEPTAPAGPATSHAAASAIGDAMSHRSDLISQPGATYFKTIARIGAQTADALAYAHAQGICHRDIKPSNLLLDSRGTVWVADFGLAKTENSEGDGLTHTGDIVGTLRYMAPERFDGRADAASDIYALGATMYEMLTLRPAFAESDRLTLIDRIIHGAAPRPRSIDERIPGDLETIVLKAMTRETSGRYVSARAFAEDLERFLADRSILARRSSARERAWRWCRRNRAVAALIALVATLTVLVAIVSTVAALVSIRQLDSTKKAERHSQLALGESLMSESAALQRTGQIGQRFDSLDRLAKAAIVLGGDREGRARLREIRRSAITALGLTDLRVLWQRDLGETGSLSTDSALERYAVAGRSGTLVVNRLDDHRELVRLPGPEQRGFRYVEAMFSPDGELLAAVYGGTRDEGNLLRVWHLARRELLASFMSRGCGAFSPDSLRLMFCPLDGGIGVWDRPLRRVVRRLSLDFAPHFLAIDPDGRRLAVNSADAAARVAILEIESGRMVADWRSQVGNTNLAWSGDSQLLAIGGHTGDCRVYVWNVRRSELAAVLQGHTAPVTDVRFAHARSMLATASGDGTTRLWNAASGELLATAPGHALGFAPDDRRMAFRASGSLGVWEIAWGDECRTLHAGMVGNRSEKLDATPVSCAEFSPDGRLLATGDRAGVRLWESDSGREIAHLKDSNCGSVLFHPDGQSLIIHGAMGLYRWPIDRDPEHGADALTLGPPELLRESTGSEWNKAAWLPDHHTVAMIDNARARVVLVDSAHPHPARSRAVVLDSGENRRMTSVAVSADGHWLAVGGWKEAGIRVWDLRRRQLERLLRPNDDVSDLSFVVGFTPDGRWLVSRTGADSGGRHEFWRTGTWERGLRIDIEGRGIAFDRPAFTADGRSMALAIAPDQVMLADSATGREHVRLTTLRPIEPMPLAFSPDGTKLVAGTTQNTALVWDLRRIRDQLASRGLDWHAAPYPASPAIRLTPGPMGPVRPVRIIGEVLERQARRRAELAAMDRRLAVNPDDTEALSHRGWLFLTDRRTPEAIADLNHLHRLEPDCPDVDWMLGQAYQDGANPAGALALFDRILRREPDDQDTRFQRGLIAFALGRTQQAADDFARVLAADPTRDMVRYHHARTLNRLGRYRDALAEVDLLFTRHPNDFALFQLRGTACEAVGEREPARLAWEKAHSLLPNDAPELNKHARVMATGPLAGRDPERAVVLARQAVALAPDHSVYLNTLGAALYGVGRYAEAIDVLERSMKVGRSEPDGIDLFFLAMAHHGLGQPGRARTFLDRAVHWRDRKTGLSAGRAQELAAVRAEAEAVLAGPGGDLPIDVIAPL